MNDYAVVIAGGRIDDDFALRFLHGCAQRPLLIAADRGLLFLDRHGIVPDLVAGDFDSAGEAYLEQYLTAHPGVEVQRYSWEKDYTDTEIAVRQAYDRGCRKIDILGATGTRFDHMLGSVQILAMLMEQGAEGRILDPHNRITMHRESFRIRKEEQWGKYISFFAWGGDVYPLTLKGFHFPLKDGTLTCMETRAVSNQIEEEKAEVIFHEGRLLMVESKDSP